MEDILILASALSGAAPSDEVLSSLCSAAEVWLEKRLRPGVLPSDCGRAFPVAAAAIAAGAWESAKSGGDIASFSAGSVSLTAEPGKDRFLDAAMGLMEPWMKDGGFAFLGV